MTRYKSLVSNLEDLEREAEAEVESQVHYVQSNLPYETDKAHIVQTMDDKIFNKVKRVIRQPMHMNHRGGSSINQVEHYGRENYHHHNTGEHYYNNNRDNYHLDAYGNEIIETPVFDTSYSNNQQQTAPYHITQPEEYSCMDVATHVQNCPICTRFYGAEKNNNNNSTLYIIVIIVLSLLCILLAKKVIEDK